MGKMKYSIRYEFERYEVHLYVKGSGADLGGNNFFYSEDNAVAYAMNYVKEHPGWTYRIFRIEKAIIEVEE